MLESLQTQCLQHFAGIAHTADQVSHGYTNASANRLYDMTLRLQMFSETQLVQAYKGSMAKIRAAAAE